MRKILLTFLVMLFALPLFSFYYTWDSNVVAVYELDNNGNDSSGNGYNLVNVGNGGAFDAVLFKSGTHSSQIVTTHNAKQFPVALENYLDGLSNWTIEGWHYMSTGFWQPAIAKGWNYAFGTFCVVFNQGSTCSVYSPNPSTIATGLSSETWYHWSMQYNGTKIQMYLNGEYKTEATASNPYENHDYLTTIGDGYLYPDLFSSTARNDKIIVSKSLRNGVETMPLGILESPAFDINRIKFIGDIYIP